MNYTHSQLRKAFSDFWLNKQHCKVVPAPLVLANDPTTLFNSSGMQQLVPYLIGESHPLGKRLFDIQPCIRTVDIEEVGDNRHLTFFEMMGNWSLGDYFKEKQLVWIWDFYTNILGFPAEKLYVSIFAGDKKYGLSEDTESRDILTNKIGIPEDRIRAYGPDKNWWSRSGIPEQMPVGEIGGPDVEVFYDFGTIHNQSFGKECHPNCDCGRFVEIGNSVFIQYRKTGDRKLAELPNKNVDFGGGFERILATLNHTADSYQTELFLPQIRQIEKISGKRYEDPQARKPIRIIADHIKASVFLIHAGVYPSNKEHGYVVRKLLRRSALKLYQLGLDMQKTIDLQPVTDAVLTVYDGKYFDKNKDSVPVADIVNEEVRKFMVSINRGLAEMKKIREFNGMVAFDFYQNYGFPVEVMEEMLKDRGVQINRDEFRSEFEKHRQLSRTASAGKFKGGLADQSEQVVKYHTATHLIHQALFDVLGNDIRQEGSNITGERLRFDFYSSRKPTSEEIRQVEKNAQQKIDEALPMAFKIMPKTEALSIGAKAFFREKYPDQVKIYYIGKNLENAYSKEFCGGPHVGNTKEVGQIKIFKFEKIGSNLYRLYAR